MDITDSIHLFARNPNEFALQFKREIYEHTRIECTIGIAPNLLMSKVALDIEAKKRKTESLIGNTKIYLQNYGAYDRLVSFGGFRIKQKQN